MERFQSDIAPAVSAFQIARYFIASAHGHAHAQEKHVVGIFFGIQVTGTGNDDFSVKFQKTVCIPVEKTGEHLLKLQTIHSSKFSDQDQELGHYLIIGDADDHGIFVQPFQRR